MGNPRLMDKRSPSEFNRLGDRAEVPRKRWWSRKRQPAPKPFLLDEDEWEERPLSPLYDRYSNPKIHQPKRFLIDDDDEDGADYTGREEDEGHEEGDFYGWEEPPQKPRRSARRKWISRIIAGLLALFMALVAWLAITAPLSKSLQPLVPPEITLLAADGTPIARNGASVEAPVVVSELPPHVVEAFLAIEDRRFYSHWGIDPLGIARALWSNITTGRTQGGSTITQQLAKFTFLSAEQSLTRKGREALIAFWLEAWLTKDEILERYLSNAYFGDNSYGLRAASLHYFYRQPENLRVEQAAMLAGLLQAPSRYAPTKNYALAEERMRVVLQAMVDAGYLTQERAKSFKSPRLDVRSDKDLPTGTYFADWALPQARKLSEGGYSREAIATTLDSRLQAAARRAVNQAGLGSAQVALVAMRPNGEVVAMIGGRDYAKSAFNRATQAQRQPGSTFKLFVYLAALRDGMEPSDILDNSEFTQGSYRPRNADGRYSPTITLENAFARSSNVAAVRLFQQVGSDKVVATARDFGITTRLDDGDPSMALGTSTMTLLDLTAAYAGVAANRFPVEPRAFAAEEAGWLDWLWNRQKSLSRREHNAIQQLLRAAINNGTGRAARLSVPNFGKTGTTQNSRDALFVGYAGDLVVGVWVGNDDNTPLNNIGGGGLPARIWRDFMAQAIGVDARPKPPRKVQEADVTAPVEPQDVPAGEALPTGNLPVDLRIDEEGTTVSTQIGNLPVDVRVSNGGVSVQLPQGVLPSAPSSPPQAAPNQAPAPTP